MTAYSVKTGSGGAIDTRGSKLSISGSSSVMFANNAAKHGGAIHCYTNSNVSFYDSSTIKFYENRAAVVHGGAVYTRDDSCAIFHGNSLVSFIRNTATYGGAGRVMKNSNFY